MSLLYVPGLSRLGYCLRGMGWLSLVWVAICCYFIHEAEAEIMHRKMTEAKIQPKRNTKNIACKNVDVVGDLTPGSLSEYTHCETLKLNRKNISYIANGSFAEVARADVLHLIGNHLVSVHGGMWEGLASLESLNLPGNLIQHLAPHAFANLPKLRILDLSLNQIKEIRSDIWEPENQITLLSLRGNLISHLPPRDEIHKNLNL